jgi:AraC family transcriptional regulator, arabinose operon regulatory protein
MSVNAIAPPKKKLANRKDRGFTGERIIEVPKDALHRCQQMPLISRLFIARMGVYPKALYHYYQRPAGISQVILLYCTDGQGWVQLPEGRISLRANQVFAISPGVAHSYGADAKDPWTIYWLHLGGRDCAEAVRAIMNEPEPGGVPQAVGIPFSEERLSLFDRIENTFLKGYSRTNLLYANLTLPALLASLSAPENFQSDKTPGESSPTGKAIQFMRSNLTRTLSLENIAQSAQLSVSFFSRRFKDDTGYSPIDYFNHLRIQKACQLLHFSELRINEVAAQVGMFDPFYFSRLFKRQMGVSPLEYRKREGMHRATEE